MEYRFSFCGPLLWQSQWQWQWPTIWRWFQSQPWWVEMTPLRLYHSFGWFIIIIIIIISISKKSLTQYFYHRHRSHLLIDKYTNNWRTVTLDSAQRNGATPGANDSSGRRCLAQRPNGLVRYWKGKHGENGGFTMRKWWSSGGWTMKHGGWTLVVKWCSILKRRWWLKFELYILFGDESKHRPHPNIFVIFTTKLQGLTHCLTGGIVWKHRTVTSLSNFLKFFFLQTVDSC